MPLLTPGTRQFEALLAFLVSRQTAQLSDEPEDEVLDEIPGTSLYEKIQTLPDITPRDGDAIPCAGFNGRCNKVADTCYSFWNEASLLVGEPCSHMWPSADSPRCWIDYVWWTKRAIGDISSRRRSISSAALGSALGNHPVSVGILWN